MAALIVTALSAVAAFQYLVAEPTRYEARARLLVGALAPDFDAIRAAEELVATYVEIASTDPLLERAIAEGNLDVDLTEFRSMVKVAALGSSRILLVTARHHDATFASRAVDAVSRALQEFDAESQQTLTILDTEELTTLFRSRLVVLLLLAALGGGAVTVGLLTLLDPRGTWQTPPGDGSLELVETPGRSSGLGARSASRPHTG